MDVLAREYHDALQSYNGHLLAATISPVAPPHFLNRLDTIRYASDSDAVQNDVGYSLTKHARRAISKEDRQVLELWSEIYTCYWHTLNALVAAQVPNNIRPDWSRVYDLWKELANTVIRGFTSGVLENWALPVLYMAGRHLRIFAIKADETKINTEGELGVDMGGLQDDIAGDFGKNKTLEDAARVINRMFTLCISDRYVEITKCFGFIQESRKSVSRLLSSNITQGPTRRIPQMGPLLHRQPPLQDLL